MKRIREVEVCTGISRKRIHDYVEKGYITPEKKLIGGREENIFSDVDIEILKKADALMGVSVKVATAFDIAKQFVGKKVSALVMIREAFKKIGDDIE